MKALLANLWILLCVATAFAVLGGAVVLLFAFAGFTRIFLPVAAFAALAGTVYWVCHARGGPDWDRELMGLIGLYAILADTLIIGYACYVACDGFRP